MRVFQISASGATESGTLPTTVAVGTTTWISCSREEFDAHLPAIQATLQNLRGMQLVDLHVSDLRNIQLTSRYDYTTQYDLLVFRRLTMGQTSGADQGNGAQPHAQLGNLARRGGPPILRRIDTSAVGFALFDDILLSVHPADCAVRDAYAMRLLAATQTVREGNARLPTSAADLMLRIVNQIVDQYLDLRRELSRQLDHWQSELLAPHTRFTNWGALLDARLALHALDDVADDQRTAIQDWTASLENWPAPTTSAGQREYDLLKVRSRDVLEHIERVLRHVRRLEQNAETTVQMHFSAQGHRTNEIMRTLTALTAVFLPLNLITGFFGMNFDVLPLVHRQAGIWWATGFMSMVAVGLVAFFWRKRYLARTVH
ncbi:MAG: magnesium transporter CorA family protein [Burkholderiaceae bacterium]